VDAHGFSLPVQESGVRDFSGRPSASQTQVDYFDLITVHSMVLPVSMKPLPLHEFCPLQALLALLQALCPLQALAPAQTTPAADAAVANVLTAKAMAAVANMVRLVTCFSLSMPRFFRCGRRNYGPHFGVTQ
jgi:hypothetical protein